MPSTVARGASSEQPTQVPLRSRILSVAGRGIISTLVLIAALMVFGTFVPGFPVIGLAGFIVGIYAVWFVILPLLGAGAAWFIWRRRRTRFGTSIVVLGVITALASVVITVRMIRSVEAAGADINVSQLFQTAPLAGPKPDSQPVYLTRGGESLKIYVYRPSATVTNAPILVYIHGGGWTIGSPDDRAADMRWFADRGFLVLSVQYSLSSPTLHLWNVTQGQIGCALSWVTDNASKYGGDASRVALTGASAGGNLAINTSYLQAAGKLPSACGGRAPDIAAVSVTYPAVDVKSVNDDTSAGATFARNYTGGSPRRFPERYAAIDSSNKITTGAPPTLIVAGKSDHIVPPQSVIDFANRTRNAGIETKLVRVPYADHAFDVINNNIGDQAYRQLTLKWLSQHGQAP